MRRTYRTLNDYEMQHNEEVGLLTRPSTVYSESLSYRHTMEERRQLERFDLRLPAEIEVVSRVPGLINEKLSLQTENICSGGAFFHTPSPLPEGTQVKIDMRLNFRRLRNMENRHPLVKVKGSVLRSEPTGMAIQFDRGYDITLSSNT